MALAAPAAAAMMPARARSKPAASRAAARAAPCKGGYAGASAPQRLPCMLRSSRGATRAYNALYLVVAAAGRPDELAPESDQPAAARNVRVLLLVAVLELVVKVLELGAKVLPLAVYAAFGFYMWKNDLLAGLATLHSLDWLSIAVFGVGGWAFQKNLEYVNKRFDAIDKRFDKRFDAIFKHFDGIDQHLADLDEELRKVAPSARDAP